MKIRNWWDAKEKGDKISFCVKAALWTLAAVFLLMILFSKQWFGEDSVLGAIIGGSSGGFKGIWDAIVAKAPTILKSIALIIITLAVSKLIRFILKKLLSHSKKGITVIKLIDSFIKYAAAVIMILLLLGAWGVDTATLLASVGILGLVVGLGAQSLIADIIAGLFIVFEGEYQVGDIVVIGDWRGTVQEIGIRTTKVIDAAGNIKIVNNSSISEVINQTQELSLATCEAGIEYGESIERVEMVIRDNLDKIRTNIPAIVDGPYYKGVKTLNSSSVDLLFVARCKEEDLYQVQRDMNREIKIMFDENGINIPFPQIVLNQPNTFKHKESKKSLAKEAKAFVEVQKAASKDLEEKI